MQEEHLGLAANCSRTNMSDKQRQPINMNTNMAQMGSFNKSLSTKPNDVNPNSKGKITIYKAPLIHLPCKVVETNLAYDHRVFLITFYT